MNNKENKKKHNQDLSTSVSYRRESGGFKSLSRFLIGTIGLGLEEFSERLDKWEQRSNEFDIISSPEIINYQDQPDKTINSSGLYIESIKSDSFRENLRFALIGLLIDSQDRIEATSRIMQPIGSTLYRITRPIINTVGRIPVIAPIRKGYSSLVERGEDEFNRLILLGRIEYQKSHQIAEIAIDDTFEETVDYLATNQEIQELIQSQSVGFAGEVVEEIRERAVSTDNFIDGTVRSFLKRKPRSEIPTPQFDIESTKSV